MYEGVKFQLPSNKILSGRIYLVSDKPGRPETNGETRYILTNWLCYTPKKELYRKLNNDNKRFILGLFKDIVSPDGPYRNNGFAQVNVPHFNLFFSICKSKYVISCNDINFNWQIIKAA